MSKWFVVLLQLMVCSFLSAQNASIKGIVADSFTEFPMPYASVSLFKTSDSSLVHGAVCDSAGGFLFGKLKPGSFFLKVQFVGYRTKRLPSLLLNGGQRLDVGVIMVDPDQRILDEIEIVGQRTPGYNKVDKQVYRADQFETAKGGSAIDVLKNMPSIAVTGQGEISLRGSTGFLVLIDGKPVLTDAQTALSQLPANIIENIEVITAPSARYDPDGKSGIINVVTKKGSRDGLNISANLLGGFPSTNDHGNMAKPIRFGGDATINYQKEKLEISLGGNYNRNDVAGFREGEVFTRNNNNTNPYITRFPSSGERSFDRYNYAGRASIRFTPGPRNTYSAGFSQSRRFQARTANIVYHNTSTYLNTDMPFREYRYYNGNLQTKEGHFTLANAEYTHNFLNKSALTVTALYEKADLSGNTKNVNLRNENLHSDTAQFVFNPYKTPISGIRLGLNYTLPFKNGKLETGYQYRYDNQNGTYDYHITPLPDPPDSIRFAGSVKAKNLINSFYSQYSGISKRFEYSAGLRFEHAERTVNLSYDPLPHKLRLANFFPSANALYTFATGWKLKAGYSKRVQRTNNYELNPIPEREHSETLEQGDPDLLPEFVDLSELGVIRSFAGGSVFVTLYHQHIKNPIQRVNSVYADTILNRVFTNAERARSLGLEMTLNVQPTPWWTIYVGSNLYNYRIHGMLKVLGETSEVENTAWAYSVNMNMNFRLSDSWSIQGNVNYLSDRPTAQGNDSWFLTPNAAIKKTFLNSRISAMLQWQNIDLNLFGSNRQRITAAGASFYTTTNYIYETDVLVATVSYNLSRLTPKSKMPQSELEQEF